MTTRMIMIEPPKILAVCDMCWEHNQEASCFPIKDIMWSNMHSKWLCDCCWEEHDYDDAEVVNDLPPRVDAYASDVVDNYETMKQRLVVAVTARRLGV